ncbi:hypothetical protein Q9L58_008726 [Maublancomyces gigas]|uniref:Uncharacterized protein n=1 Tax=Discina gigas TaxID=1032678 RepID=A0ABR3G961_9PEZI
MSLASSTPERCTARERAARLITAHPYLDTPGSHWRPGLAIKMVQPPAITVSAHVECTLLVTSLLRCHPRFEIRSPKSAFRMCEEFMTTRQHNIFLRVPEHAGRVPNSCEGSRRLGPGHELGVVLDRGMHVRKLDSEERQRIAIGELRVKRHKMRSLDPLERQAEAALLLNSRYRIDWAKDSEKRTIG